MRFVAVESGLLLLINTLLMTSSCEARVSAMDWASMDFQSHQSPAAHHHRPGDVNGLSIDDQAQSSMPMSQLLSAIRRLLQFFMKNTQDLNYDAILGTRIAQGQLSVLLEKLVTSPASYAVSASDGHEIYRLTALAKSVSDQTVPLLRSAYPQYYAKMGPLIDQGIWTLDYPPRTTNPDLIYPVVSADETLNESISDECISELLGTGLGGSPPCYASDQCWDLMTIPRSSRYSLAHVILYLEVGEIMGCEKEMEEQTTRRVQPSFRHLMAISCANSLQEMKEMAAKGFLEKDRDLFLEQSHYHFQNPKLRYLKAETSYVHFAAVCGMLNFRDFFRHSWLHEILSWQKTQGCYGGHSKRDSQFNRSSSSTTANKFLDDLSRVKREEKYLEDGCLAHKSAVAVAALSVYVVQLAQDPTLSSATY